MDFLNISEDWKKHSTFIDKGGFRKSYSYKGLVLKKFFRKCKFSNQLEFENFKKVYSIIDKKYQKYFYKIYGIKKISDYDLLVTQLIINNDNNISKTIEKFGIINDENFWKILDEIFEMFIEKKIYFYDINFKNILVKKEKNNLIPIFIDYKRFWRNFFLQFFLFFESQKINKMKRNYNRLKKDFYA